MQLIPSKQAIKFIRNLQKSDPKSAKIVIATIENLAENPAPMGSKKLQNMECRSVVAGDFRVIYLPTEELVMILLVGKRNDKAVYRQLARM